MFYFEKEDETACFYWPNIEGNSVDNLNYKNKTTNDYRNKTTNDDTRSSGTMPFDNKTTHAKKRIVDKI